MNIVIAKRALKNEWSMLFIYFISNFFSGCSFSQPNVSQYNLQNAFYIDAINGDDAHSGKSPAQAWKTLAKVNSQVFKPGNKLLFKAGTKLVGQLKIQGAGAKDKLIIINRYGKGPKPKISANGLHQAALLLYNTQYIQVNNLDISNQGESRQAKRYGVQIEIADFGTANGISLRNLDVHDVNGSNVKKEGGGAGIHWINRGQKVKSAFDGLLIENCKIERTDRNGITSSAILTAVIGSRAGM